MRRIDRQGLHLGLVHTTAHLAQPTYERGAGRPLSQEVVSALNAGLSLPEVADVAAQIGYPVMDGPTA